MYLPPGGVCFSVNRALNTTSNTMGKRLQRQNVFSSAKKQQKSLISQTNVNFKHPYVKMNAIQGIVVGTCKSMCPQAEIALREKELLVHPFEVQQGTETWENPSGDPQKMVKMYSRPAAGRVDPLPSDLRPPDVLLNTVRYLLNRVAPREDCRWTEVFEFVSDRLRAVRQDLIIQSISGRTTIQILEATVIFHIYAGYRLCTEPVAAFVPTLNNNHIQESLKWLLSQYQESDSHHDNRVLFESIYLLYNLGNSDALRHCLQLDGKLRSSALLQTAYRISVSHMLGDYSRVMRLTKGLSSVHCQMAAHRHFVELKRSALRTMSAGYNSKNLRFPVSKLTELLPLDSESDSIALCRDCGLSVLDRKVQFVRTAFKSDAEIKPAHVSFIDMKLKSVPVTELFLKHLTDNGKHTAQPPVPTRVQMSLPFKFSRLKLESEKDD